MLNLRLFKILKTLKLFLEQWYTSFPVSIELDPQKTYTLSLSRDMVGRHAIPSVSDLSSEPTLASIGLITAVEFVSYV